MSKKKLTIIIVALVVGVIVLALGTSYALFTFNVTKGTNFKALVGKLELSITDTINEDRIVINDLVPTKEEDALQESGYTFTVTNTGSIDAAFTVYLDDVVPQGESKGRIADNLMRANLTNSKSGKNYTFSLENNRILDTGVLTSGESITYTLRLWLDYSAGNEAQNKYFASRIRIDSVQSKGLALLKDVVLEQNKVVTSAPTLTSTSEAANEKGLYKMSVTNGFGGQDGDTYYFRGNVTNNYVNFAGYTWRIVRINEDGTIRLIMQDGINNNATYQYNADATTVASMYYSNSAVKNVLDSWYQDNIVTKGFGDLVATGNYFCQAAKVKYNNGYSTGSATTVRNSEYIPDFNCPTNDGNVDSLLNLPVGTISVDEIVFAGGRFIFANTNYYLNVSNSFMTMSIAGINSENNKATIWGSNNNNYLYNYYVDGNFIIRPVINLKATTKVTGNGTSSQPYVVVMNEDNNYQVSSAVAAAVSQFNPSDLKDVIMCDQSGDKYVNCKIYNTIDAAITDRNTGTIILTDNITRDSKIDIPAQANLTLDLNGKKIETVNENNLDESDTTWNKNYCALDIYGTLTINDSGTDGAIISNIAGDDIYVESTGNLTINGGNYNGRRSVDNYGKVVINNGTFQTKLYNIFLNTRVGAELTINNGRFIDNVQGSTAISTTNGDITINDGYFEALGSLVNNNSDSAVVNINGGTYIAGDFPVRNLKTSTINITQTTKPIYIASLAKSWKPALTNNTSGTINIVANKANACTTNYSDTTSGLCVYAEGDKATSGNTGNGALQNGTGGTVNINGGTYFGWHQGLNNNTTGTINVKNATVISEYTTLLNNSSNGDGTINVETSECVSRNGVVISNNRTGIINLKSGVYKGNTGVLRNNSSNYVTITGGTYLSTASDTLANQASGSLNVIQTDSPIYISVRANEWKTAIVNTSTGTLNISGSAANVCTGNENDTTSGLCVYGTDKGSLVLSGATASGTININGGTYNNALRALVNRVTTYNIKNATVNAITTISVEGAGTTNVCDSTINATSLEFNNTSSGTINYNNVTFSNGTTAPNNSKIYNPSGTITASSTCPISE